MGLNKGKDKEKIPQENAGASLLLVKKKNKKNKQKAPKNCCFDSRCTIKKINNHKKRK